MPYGTLTPIMQDVIERTVRAKRVADLGAGDLTFTRMLVEHASWVVAVDAKIPRRARKSASRPYRLAEERFEDFSTRGCQYDVAFVSWPSCFTFSLTECIRPAKTVIYLGQNDDIVTCGAPGFWEELTSRCIRKVVEHPYNTLVVYGGRRRSMKPRPLLVEEENGLQVWGRSYDPLHDDWF